MIFLKALSLSFKSLPSVYEEVSGILVCGTKVATRIRSLFCNVALLVPDWLLGSLVPLLCSLFEFLYSGRLKP